MKQPESIIFALAQVSGKELKHQVTEVQRIRFGLKDAERGRHVIVDYDPSLTYQSLSDKLFSNQGPDATILHYSGHSSHQGLWVTSLNKDEIIDAKRLSTLVKAYGKFRLVFLNSCDSYEIARELIGVDVPYVICTTDLVEDGSAALVAAEFYKFLGYPGQKVETAFQLTADYLDEHFQDAGGRKGAARTFQIGEDQKNGFIWELVKHPELTDEQKNWVLVPEVTGPSPLPQEETAGRERKGGMRKIQLRITVILSLVIPCLAVILYFVITSSLHPDIPRSIPPDKKTESSKDATNVKKGPSQPSTTPLKKNTVKSIDIEGSVKDNGTGEPLDSVHVIINGVKTVTKSGMFKVKLPVNAFEKSQEISVEYTFKKDGYQLRTQTEIIFIDNRTTSHSTNASLTKLNERL